MKATVVNNVENTTRVVDLPESISTVSLLKNFLQVSDGRIFEGVTHTDLDNDNNNLPQLPEEKRERGYVFFVSPAQNKTKNGVYSRTECYALIKSKGLAEKVKSIYHRNFTQVPTADLNKIIEDNKVKPSNNKVQSSNNKVVSNTPTDTLNTSNKNITEKDLWKAIIDVACPQDKKSLLNNMIDKVFPNPYSVQDLSNMSR